MDGKNAVPVVPRGSDRINILPHQVGRIELQPQARAGNESENFVPEAGRGGEVVGRRVILPAHAHIELFEYLHVSFIYRGRQRFCLIVRARTGNTAAERADKLASEPVGKLDTANEVLLRVTPLRGIGLAMIEAVHGLDADDAYVGISGGLQNLVNR